MFAHLGPEALLVSFALLLSLLCPQLGASWFEKVERLIATLARRRTLSILVCGLSALALRIALLPWLPIPTPSINDEFSFLLAGDTFAHGRLTNPSHPMWVHFETFHVIFHPTYASMYPPLQGVLLAAGQVIGKQPFWGVWLSAGLMCAAFCWMFQAWLPPSWALLGGMLPVMRFGVLSYWDNSYWGGAVAATAGALVFGGLPRIMRYKRVRDTIVMAIGIAMLANTRPYEGMVLSIFIAAVLLTWMVRKKLPARTLLTRIAAPMLLILLLSGVATAYYFWRVTGNALKMPQQLNRDTYAIAKYFYWQSPYPEPTYRNKAIQDFYGKLELGEFEEARTVPGFFLQTLKMTARAWTFFLAPALTLPLFSLRQIARDRRVRIVLSGAAVGLASSAAVIFFNINYLAPVVAALLVVVVQGMRHLRLWSWEGKQNGLFLVRAIVVICVVMVPIQLHILVAAPGPGTCAAIGSERAALEARLSALPGSQLVLVRYGESHDPMLEWVYNSADIDMQKVVWARDMGADRNKELLHYYSNRHVWLLEPDALPPKLTDYSSERGQVLTMARDPNTETQED